MKTKALGLLIMLIFNSCQSQDCPDGINLLPMYGLQTKCKEQIASDEAFLFEIDSKFKSREEASKSLSAKGWEYFYKNNLDLSMKRFNQSWLLDKTNYQVYWGFANIKGKQGKAAEAIELFNMAKTYKPDHTNFYISSASAYSNLFQQNQDTTLLQLMINDLDRAIQLDPKNARAYAELAATYHFKNNKVKALENFKLAEKIDPSVVNPQLRNALTN